MLTAIFACLFAAEPPSRGAEDDPQEILQAAFETEEITVEGRRPRALDEIGAVATVIDAETLEDRQYTFVADALRESAGVSVARNGAFGGVASARIRGATSGQTLVVIDGAVVNDPTAPQGGYNFADLDAASVERIEILRGPQSVVWGADAIGGVISVTTRKGDGVSGFVEGGSRATFRGAASIGAGDDDDYARFGASAAHTNGVSRAAGGAENDGYRLFAATASAGRRLGNDTRASFTARFTDSRSDIDGFPPPNFTLADTAEVDKTRQWQAVGRLDARSPDIFNAEIDHQLILSYAAVDRRTVDGGAETFSARGNRLQADYVAVSSLRDWLTATVGASLGRQRADVSGVDDSQTRGAVFALADLTPHPDVAISAAVRRDEISGVAGATTFRTTGRWNVWGRGDHDRTGFGEAVALRASWGEGFRAPSLFELHYDEFGVTPNPDLAPEEARGFDAGAEFTSFAVERRGGLRRKPHVRLRANYFRQNVRNQIDFDLARFGYYNIARARSEGVEAEATADFGAWSLAAAYTFTDAVNLDTRAPLLRVPRHAGQATVGLRPIPALNLSATVIVNGEEPDFPADNAPFTRLDLRAAYDLSRRLSVYGRIENATDKTYQDVSGFGEPGVSAFVGLRVSR